LKKARNLMKKIRWLAFFAGLLILGLLAGERQQAAAQTQPPASVDPAPAVQQATDSLPIVRVVLNEVMPKSSPSEAAWVELHVLDVTPKIFLPAINGRPATAAAVSQPVLAAPQAVLQTTLDLSSWQVTNQSGGSYSLPGTLVAVPTGTFILIHFDGAGAGQNDLDPADKLIELHTPAGLEDIFPDEAGQVGLYRSGPQSAESIADYLAWGGFDEAAAAHALQAGVWGRGQAASFENGFGDISEADLLEAGESLGRFPGAIGNGVTQWANYPDGYTTPGQSNPVPPVLFTTPQSGAQIPSNGASLSWRMSLGADGYQFQFDDAPDFSDPIIDDITEDTFFELPDGLADGEYFWRIKPIYRGYFGQWSQVINVHLLDILDFVWFNQKVLDIDRVRQNKDSRMLGLDGAPEGDPTTDLPENAWDAPAPCTEPPCADTTKYTHGSMYCVRASIRMMASFYNGSLTMDRISYYILEEWSGNTRPGANDGIPDNDLGYARGMYYPDEEDEGISWALNSTIVTPGGKPTFQQIKDFINADRPIMFRNPGHMMVINGYQETLAGEQFIHVLDPDQPPNFERWQAYDTQTIDGYWPGPTSGTAKSDEAGVSTDSDGDGIVDFDEVVRFNLDPLNDDSDNDWVPDKRDMREYVFDALGNYSKRTSDFDLDGLRKEVDPDNDNDGSPDGCEDNNYNGIFQGAMGETDNFNAGSSQACQLVFDILYPLKLVPVNAGDPTDPRKILVQVSTAAPAGWSLELSPDDFSVVIGGSESAVLAVYPSADTRYLVVAPPIFPVPDFYDLTVSLAGTGTDTEEDAVFFLPANPRDQVVILDRSGSMLTDDKIGAAKNAASAFIDFLEDGDAVGVASFASSASEDFALTAITNAGVRTNAINTVDSLAASGLTALGQGAQTGYDMLLADGDPAHDWSMVLLSDGWENVLPFWSTVGPGITEAVVHTVALGEDADKGLLQSIAGAKHGEFFYVNVDPPPVAALLLDDGVRAPAEISQLVLPTTLPNRLADVYLAIGELTQGLQRLLEGRGPAESGSIIYNFTLVEPIPELVFTLNWDTPQGQLEMLINDPSGAPVTPDVINNSDTHSHQRVFHPATGDWQVTVRVLEPANEHYLAVSGFSPITLNAAVDLGPQGIHTGGSAHLLAVLTDVQPIKDADVVALVTGPGIVPGVPGRSPSDQSVQVILYDDGAHGDGQPDDGLYAAEVGPLLASGGYSVKVYATGTSNGGQPFTRHANTGFSVQPRAAYLYNENPDTAVEFSQLLADHNWQTDLIHLQEALGTNFNLYDLVIVGPETGSGYDFDNLEAARALSQWPVPILGLGRGGAALFSYFELNIGYGHTWFSNNNQVYPVDPVAPFWNLPYAVAAGDAPVQLYPNPLTELGVHLPAPITGVTPIGRELTDANHYPLIQEERSGRTFMLWGYNAGPPAMTEAGWQTFINLVESLR
jgi:hypothetical protein